MNQEGHYGNKTFTFISFPPLWIFLKIITHFRFFPDSPTSIAFLRLGDVAVKQNNRNEAIAYYSKAAEAGGDVAEEAKRKLAALTQ